MVHASTARAPETRSPARLRWGRIVLGALLLEIALLVLLVPVMQVVDHPFSGVANGDYTVFFLAVPVACVVVGFGAGLWTARCVTNRPVLQAGLSGVVATAMYLGLCAVQPGGIAAVAAGYGLLPFIALNGLRIVSAAAGGAFSRRR